jgi:FtsP/CotA-like multicopper oxidase with cupredoxin domain
MSDGDDNNMPSGLTRRGFMAGLGAGAAALPLVDLRSTALAQERTAPARRAAPSYRSVVTPGIETLPYEMDGDVKVFRLTAEPVTVRFQDMSDPNGVRRRPINCWGYNGSVIGPTIEAVEGDRVRIIVRNNLPEPTTVHWHGLHVPIEMDGVTGFSQPPIEPGDEFVYEFTLEQHGTYFYHLHFMGAKQVGMGLSGFFIIHPRDPSPDYAVDHDYAYFLQIWMIHPSSSIPDTLEMTDFNYFTMNGRPGPDIVPMTARSGDKVRIRVANLSMLAHPIHLHGHSFRVTEYGAGFLPPPQQIRANTVNISSAEVRAFEFEAYRPGKWLFHCHFMHHVMNDMHRNPFPGTSPGHAAHEMGGMHTWIEITA